MESFWFNFRLPDAHWTFVRFEENVFGLLLNVVDRHGGR